PAQVVSAEPNCVSDSRDGEAVNCVRDRWAAHEHNPGRHRRSFEGKHHMWHAGRVIAALSVTVLTFVSLLANAQTGSNELFPKPASLAPAVEFWTRVYTEVTTKEGFIHDSLRLDIVYETIGPADDRERRRRIDRATEKYQAILNKLARG